jgi:vacuolar-type H+-ATPase subunit C/Vma6
LSQTTLYANVLVKIGAERSHFLSETKFRGLADAKNLVGLVGLLRESNYQQEIAKIIPPLSSRKLERAFNENLIGVYIKIIKNSHRIGDFLQHYLIKVEIENIKTLIKSTNAKLSSEKKQAKIYISPETYLNHRTIMEDASKALSIKQIVSALKKTEYFSTLKMGFGSYEEDGSTTCLDVLLDKFYYEKLWERFQNLPKKEKPHAYPYVSGEVDSYVLLLLLRGKLLNYDSNWLRVAVPARRFRLSNRIVEDIVCSADFESALKIVHETIYAKYFVKAQSSQETMAIAETAFDKTLLEHAKKTRFTDIFNVGAVLAFLFQKNLEVRNLTAVTLGIEAGEEPDDIGHRLLF